MINAEKLKKPTPVFGHYFSTSLEKSTFWPRRVGDCRALMFCYFSIKGKVRRKKNYDSMITRDGWGYVPNGTSGFLRVFVFLPTFRPPTSPGQALTGLHLVIDFVKAKKRIFNLKHRGQTMARQGTAWMVKAKMLDFSAKGLAF